MTGCGCSGQELMRLIIGADVKEKGSIVGEIARAAEQPFRAVALNAEVQPTTNRDQGGRTLIVELKSNYFDHTKAGGAMDFLVAEPLMLKYGITPQQINELKALQQNCRQILLMGRVCRFLKCLD